MKKFAALAVFLLALAVVIRLIGIGPSTLEVRITLVEGGSDVTAQFQKYVGFVPDGKTGAPTLGNIQIVRPSAENNTIFEVPSDRDIGIFVLSPGVPPFQSIVRADAGRHLIHEVVLDAGIVQVTTERTPRTGAAGIWFIGPDGQFDANDRFVDGAEFTVPAGTQVFQVGLGLESTRDSIDVVAGQKHDLHIVNELGRLRVNLETAMSFDDLSPTPVLKAVGGDRVLFDGGDYLDGQFWQFGRYDVEIGLSARFLIPIRPIVTDAGTVVIDQPENTMTIPLTLMGVEARFMDWPDDMPEYPMALLVSLSDPGLPFATYSVTANRASLIFIPPDEPHDYAVAVVADEQVYALHPIGPLSSETLKTEVVSMGGDAGLCRQAVVGFGCDLLAR